MSILRFSASIGDGQKVPICLVAVCEVLILGWVSKFAGRRDTAVSNVVPVQRSNCGIGADSAVGGREDVEAYHLTRSPGANVVNYGYR